MRHECEGGAFGCGFGHGAGGGCDPRRKHALHRQRCGAIRASASAATAASAIDTAAAAVAAAATAAAEEAG